MLYSFFMMVPRLLNFMFRRFGTLFHLHSGVSRKTKRDEIVGVFVGEKVCLENSLSRPEGGVKGRGRVRVEKHAVECKDPKWRPE
jgi:hypothetical protein